MCAPTLPTPADVLSATDAIMALPSELRLLDDGEEESHATKRVRLAHTPTADSDPNVSSDVVVVPASPSPPCPDSDPRTAPPEPVPRKRVTGKSPPAVTTNQWGTLCQVFEIGSPKVATRDAAFVDSSFEAAMSPPAEGASLNVDVGVHSLNDSTVSETLSSVESMDEDHVSSAEVVRAVPNVKAAASLKPPSKNPPMNLSPQQKRNLAKKLRKKSRQAT